MMKRKTIMLAIIVLIISWAIEICSAGVNIGVNDKHKSILESGNISIPVEIDDMDNIKAFSLTVKYIGIFTRVEFKPSDYLHEPLVLPLMIDKQNSLITIMCSATNKIVTRETNGTLGNLIFDKNANISLLEIYKAEYVNESYKLISVVSSAKPSRPILSDGVDSEEEKYKNNLYNAFPNPANPITTISYSVKELSRVNLNIYNVTGRLIRILVRSEMNQGKYSIDWDGRDGDGNPVASGIYFFKIAIGEYTSTKKLIILK